MVSSWLFPRGGFLVVVFSRWFYRGGFLAMVLSWLFPRSDFLVMAFSVSFSRWCSCSDFLAVIFLQ